MKGVRDSDRAFSFKAAMYVNQSSVCRNNGFKGHTLHNVAFNKMHRLWKTYISRKINKDFEVSQCKHDMKGN